MRVREHARGQDALIEGTQRAGPHARDGGDERVGAAQGAADA